MNISKASNVIGGKTARACDSCLIKRARWFCAADDAFLCQACDTAVHSANQLASRHERVRLESSSFKVREVSSSPPAWHQGFTRKARTRRQPKPPVAAAAARHHQLPVVPEINSSEDPFAEENDEMQFFCRVPVFDAFAEEFCTEIVKGELEVDCSDHMVLHDDGGACQDLNLEELLSNCDDEFVEFAADVESLLATGVEEESDHYCGNKDLAQGIIGCDEDSERNAGIDEFLDGKRVKIEEKDDGDDDDDREVQAAVVACNFDPEIDMDLNWEFEIGEEMKKVEVDVVNESRDEKRNMLLRLNYEAVIAAWATQGSPWTDGTRPQFNLDDFMVACLGGNCHQWGGIFGGRSSLGGNDAGREARVSRYREKRRTRLFSKKIRYEVRKLNAEKRPRMKGRFVKRTTFSGSSSLPFQLMNK